MVVALEISEAWEVTFATISSVNYSLKYNIIVFFYLIFLGYGGYGGYGGKTQKLN